MTGAPVTPNPNRQSVIPELEFPSPLSSPLPPPSPGITISSPILENVDLEEKLDDRSPRSRMAGPLPTKRGEIGFTEGVHSPVNGASSSTLQLPERHPDERVASPVATSPASSTSPAAPASSSASNTTPPATTGDTASTHSAGKRSLLSRLTRNRLPRIIGIPGDTCLRFLLQFFLLSGTITAWVIVVIRMNKQSQSNQDQTQGLTSTAPIFVHVAFGIAFLAQALLLERCIFRMRAERYLFLNPGAILPGSMRREMLTTGAAARSDVLALAPWNRPPVPTYAAALADAGIRGTGDVEDGLIGQPPPPAYGKNRGSVMVLSGFMSETHRQQARLARTTSNVSRASQVSDRPMSYMSHDSAWDHRRDIRRTLQLEYTLAHLEEGSSERRPRSPSQDSTRTVMPEPPAPAQLPPPRVDSLPRDNV